MLEFVRVRLTLWYTGVLALFLIGLSLITYFIFRHNTVRQMDGDLTELTDSFLTTFRDEMRHHSGSDAPKLAAQEAIIEHRFRDDVIVVLNPTGGILFSSADLPARSNEEISSSGLLSSGSFWGFVEDLFVKKQFFRTVQYGKYGYRGFARHFPLNGQTYTAIILESLRPQSEMLEKVRHTFVWVIFIAIIFASGGGYFLAWKSLAPVVAMSDRAGQIDANNLHERLPVRNENDELGRLASSFNQLLERVNQSFERQRRFMADASHELRTPVAILRGESEVALLKADRSPAEYRESLGVLNAEALQLTRIVEDLFTLTRADAGQYPLEPCDFYLDELVADCTHSARTLARAKQIALTCSVEEELAIRADEGLLRRMILNLLDNAIKYTPGGGSVNISVRRTDEEYAVTVTDTGPGIPKEAQSRIFERFFRADKARTRSENGTGGAGLGLSIARWIAEAHHGCLTLARSDASGSTFTVCLLKSSEKRREPAL